MAAAAAGLRRALHAPQQRQRAAEAVDGGGGDVGAELEIEGGQVAEAGQGGDPVVRHLGAAAQAELAQGGEEGQRLRMELGARGGRQPRWR